MSKSAITTVRKPALVEAYRTSDGKYLKQNLATWVNYELDLLLNSERNTMGKDVTVCLTHDAGKRKQVIELLSLI